MGTSIADALIDWPRTADGLALPTPRIAHRSLALTLLLAACSSAGDAGDTGVAGSEFLCNQVMGVSVTGDWFTSGFETAVDDGRWQAVFKLHAYIDLWADPSDPLWSTATVSPCTQAANEPDRILFTGVQWGYTTAQEWTTAFTAVVENLKARYPSVQRIDLLTMLRAPNNQRCDASSSTETVVQPFIDEAIAAVAAAYPGFVTAAPKFYAPSCDVFLNGGPHFTPEGMAAVAKVYADYYADEP